MNGRNWVQLAVLAPGSRINPSNPATTNTPLPDRNDGENREFQLNIDGQQVSGDIGAGDGFSQRLRPDGSIVPLNSIFAPDQNRTDFRLQQRIPLPGRMSVDGIFEVFNAFNRPNWTISAQESADNYLDHTAGQYRTMQAGFRFLF